MANKDPKFVRLANLHTHGMLADITDYGSLWSISGFEVKPFPNADLDPEAAAFVRAKMQRGVIEEASSDEYDEQQDAGDALRAAHLKSLGDRLGSDNANVQEATLQDIVRTTQRSIINRRLRGDSDDDGAEESADKKKGEKSSVPAGQGASA